ncbi:replication protein A 70 kDa DNA-binding subunit E-like [Gastrolobium bilobum]|uniref:replication protein A 70 kDa DNA-binding subunit E-like n=1 Tax=Gastrolobium bilobum TaxID=150636 RepID=UPI002AB2A633|nr:replication protein A 70 kDa DNA-binding subunit E-like [Gastrolobium bilobum]
MSSKYDFLKDVNPAKEDWRIKVKVVRTWKVPNFQRKNLEDNLEMGGRIHAIVKDVIGLISGIGKVCDRVVSGRKTKMVVLELDDLRGHKLECTLWEHYVDEVQSFLADNDDPHNVLIVQLGRIKCFRGKVGITNTKYTTRIVMDSKLNEIVEFKKRLSIDGVESSTRMTQLSTQSSYSFENDFLKETEKKSISDVKLCVDVTTCITYGTIKAIESKYNWWYKSCKKCPFSVYEDFEKWYCKNCQKHWEDYYPRFSVQVRVVDNTDSASFILFDRDCVSLLGMSAAELCELHFKRGADLDQFPNELNVLNEKSMLFKINVKQKDLKTNSEPKYQVSKICISEDIISAFNKAFIDPNDEANFDNARENEVVSSKLEKAAMSYEFDLDSCY